MYPDNRTRVRGQITCPRCRVDPSHISRQYWEATRQPQVQVPMDIGLGPVSNGPSSAPSELHRSAGYPDLCPRPGTSNSFRHQSSMSINPPQSQQQQPPAPVQQQQPPRSAPLGYYGHSQNSTLARQSDARSTRSGGETWRIRGVFDNHAPDVVHRRTESSPGPLPDVTRHSATMTTFQSPRMPLTVGHDSGAAPTMPRSATNCGRYTDSRNRSFTATGSLRDHVGTNFRRSELSANERRSMPSHLRTEQLPQQQHQPAPPSVSPWITRVQQQQQHQQQHQQGDRTQPSSYHTSNGSNYNGNNNFSNSAANAITSSNNSSSNNHNDNNNSNNNNNNNISSHQQTSTSNCWRSSVLSTPLSQCPLPDLVTPRRQARKQCCGILATHSVTVRWLVIVVASLGLLCSIVGTVVGVIRASGKEHLSVSLLLIGLGIVLVTMSGFAWRLTARDAPSCRAMFGFRRARSEPHRRFVPRVPHYGRPHPFSAMLYPDIPLRPPPPSYQASMQEYRLRLLLMDRPQMPTPPPPPPQHPPPPPPTYRGPATVYPRFSLNIGPSDYSRPPSYRSRPPSSVGQPSPLGPEDVDLNSTVDHHNNTSCNSAVVVSADVVAAQAAGISSSSSAPSSNPSAASAIAQGGVGAASAAIQNNGSQIGRPTPSIVNHVEVVAQV